MKAKQPKPVPTPVVGANPPGIEDFNMAVDSYHTKAYPPVKTSGIKTRGNGAAQRGVTARGPMA